MDTDTQYGQARFEYHCERVGRQSTHYFRVLSERTSEKEKTIEHTMTKKHFIALADLIRENRYAFGLEAENLLANFCQNQNPRFKAARWLGYIAGTNGKNGGKIKS